MVWVFSVLVFVPGKACNGSVSFQEFVHLLLGHRFDLEHLAGDFLPYQDTLFHLEEAPLEDSGIRQKLSFRVVCEKVGVTSTKDIRSRFRFDLDFSAQQRGPTGNSRLATSRTKHSEQTLDDDWSEAVQMCVMKPGRIL